MDAELSSILFLQIVDVSGSMSGEIINGINSSLTDWKAEIDCYSDCFGQRVYWGEIHFAESIYCIEPCLVKNYSLQPIRIPVDEAGYFETTEYAKLLQAIVMYLSDERNLAIIGNNPKIIIHIFTDGMETDEDFSKEVASLFANQYYRHAIKKIVLCGDIHLYGKYTKNIMEKFADKEAQIIILSYEEFVKNKGIILDEISMTTKNNVFLENAFI